jgi:hypothetical protein
LVESVRVDGKPRQRFVAHLAHIDTPLMSEALHQGLFWRDVEKRFNELALDEDARGKVRQKLLETVPLPDAAKAAVESARLAGLERTIRRSA